MTAVFGIIRFVVAVIVLFGVAGLLVAEEDRA